jgi:predicted nucleic acid-binding protein
VDVLVDTSIWSLALRRSSARLNEAEVKLTASLRDLIEDGRARLIGPIRQELLSGIRDPVQFERLRGRLRAFPDEVLTTADFEEAARWSNACRSQGVAGSGVDLLICAVAAVRGWQIFSTDVDFRTYTKVPIQLYPPL